MGILSLVSGIEGCSIVAIALEDISVAEEVSNDKFSIVSFE
jgi:hypothetical protein